MSRLVHWFYLNGCGPEEGTADCGMDVGGGRQPDLTVWAKGMPPRRARDKANTVQMIMLQTGAYAAKREPTSLAWLRNQPVPDLANDAG